MTKLLFFKWHSFMNEGIERGLQTLDIPYDTYFYQFTDWECDNLFMQQFRKVIQTGNYQKVLSVNFSPLISDICEEYSIPYVSWIYDAPVHIRNLEPMKNSCNTLYFFDRSRSLFLSENGNFSKTSSVSRRCGIVSGEDQGSKKTGTLSDLYGRKSLSDRICILYESVRWVFKGIF